MKLSQAIALFALAAGSGAAGEASLRGTETGGLHAPSVSAAKKGSSSKKRGPSKPTCPSTNGCGPRCGGKSCDCGLYDNGGQRKWCNDSNGWCGETQAHKNNSSGKYDGKCALDTDFPWGDEGDQDAAAPGTKDEPVLEEDEAHKPPAKKKAAKKKGPSKPSCPSTNGCGPLCGGKSCDCGLYDNGNRRKWCNDSNGWCGETQAHKNNSSGKYDGKCGLDANFPWGDGGAQGAAAPGTKDEPVLEENEAHKPPAKKKAAKKKGPSKPSCPSTNGCGPLCGGKSCDCGLYDNGNRRKWCNDRNGWCGETQAHKNNSSGNYDGKCGLETAEE